MSVGEALVERLSLESSVQTEDVLIRALRWKTPIAEIIGNRSIERSKGG